LPIGKIGQSKMKELKASKKWEDGAPMGMGFSIGYLQQEYAQKFWAGEKTWEGTHAGHPALNACVNDYVIKLVSGLNLGEKTSLRFRVLEKRMYDDFDQMVNDLGTDSLLPGKQLTEKQAAQVYRDFGEKYAEGEKKYGAVALRLEIIKD